MVRLALSLRQGGVLTQRAWLPHSQVEEKHTVVILDTAAGELCVAKALGWFTLAEQQLTRARVSCAGAWTSSGPADAVSTFARRVACACCYG